MLQDIEGDKFQRFENDIKLLIHGADFAFSRSENASNGDADLITSYGKDTRLTAGCCTCII